MDLLQHVPHDAPCAEVLSLGCGDLRDLLFSILLHGRRQRELSFTLNDWEPAVHAKNLVLLQMILDSRDQLEACGYAEEVIGASREMDKTQSTANANPGAAFASTIGVMFR